MRPSTSNGSGPPRPRGDHHRWLASTAPAPHKRDSAANSRRRDALPGNSPTAVLPTMRASTLVRRLDLREPNTCLTALLTRRAHDRPQRLGPSRRGRLCRRLTVSCLLANPGSGGRAELSSGMRSSYGEYVPLALDNVES